VFGRLNEKKNTATESRKTCLSIVGHQIEKNDKDASQNLVVKEFNIFLLQCFVNFTVRLRNYFAQSRSRYDI
jgi:hypothetical protein